MTPKTGPSGEDKTVEIIKRSVVARGWWRGKDEKAKQIGF